MRKEVSELSTMVQAEAYKQWLKTHYPDYPQQPYEVWQACEQHYAARIAELEAWKSQMLEIESQWDEQAVGKVLGINLGEPIRKNILPKIVELTNYTNSIDETASRQLVYISELEAKLKDYEADARRLDYMQSQGEKTNLGWLFRDSRTGRGFRLHQDHLHDSLNVREAIDQAIESEKT